MDELEGALPVSDRRRSQTATGSQRRPSAIRTAAVPNGPPSTYQCNEQGYLKKLASDNIAVHDPLAVVKAGYAVCAITGPADLPPSESGRDLVVDKQVAAVKVAGSDVVAIGDVDQLVDDAIMFLC